DAFDDADLQPALIENGALLDVQLDVGGDAPRRVTRVGKALGIAADAADLVRQRNPVASRARQFGGRKIADVPPAARETTFLITPDHHVERMAVVIGEV